MTPTILFEDHHLLAMCKPAPLLTQAAADIPSLEAWAKAYIKEKYAKPAGVYLGIPHRLDRPVSGVVVFARNTKAAQRIHAQFQNRTVKKTYWAKVAGHVTPDAGEWEDRIRKLQDESRVVQAEERDPWGKHAKLHYRVLQHFENETLLELIPETGRMHQLRAQCAWRGFPVHGDDWYGSTVNFGPTWEHSREKVIALHARELVLKHPFRDEVLTFTAELPEYW